MHTVITSEPDSAEESVAEELLVTESSAISNYTYMTVTLITVIKPGKM
jgi:hypothetical protein